MAEKNPNKFFKILAKKLQPIADARAREERQVNILIRFWFLYEEIVHIFAVFVSFNFCIEVYSILWVHFQSPGLCTLYWSQ